MRTPVNQMVDTKRRCRLRGPDSGVSLQDCPPIDARRSIRRPYSIPNRDWNSEYQRGCFYRSFRNACGRLKQRERPARARSLCKESATRKSCKDRILQGFETIGGRRSGAVRSVSEITPLIPDRGVST